uniref:Vacuolar-sorting protein SNF8 n=1 Tax=Chromera velia CCMP2878 TaxID=1169474 RepID=A0A0G4HRM9_9ALVE|mmetsp:Transcript_34885/g.68869  ORF Transcript_34885/g.68869 Transcript_34885/m.68869 type:complete len:288 (+) Transcript_34885:220-1083(+)|eukprot:Cvel_1288.t1-p1 / transcript=Cvel_1288.t1 / gene=Cvel_1288 / organism=Chromera_velia_CCMP2878 / gene_product=Vacuolar-sorting protein SNF8, putative / transcript_product=Vacuolar-sorting protein SNF8, putative / location=Cvel_scaffold43:96786-101619(+) / protein_length=287 / sequence_SO=supercontig / SO=protein_coding / is_pseudo=false
MRRGVGIKAVRHLQERDQKIAAVGDHIREGRTALAKEQFESFKQKLTEFASKHRKRINSDPQFRQQFFEMCNTVGVDPLTSSKGFWAKLLGTGNFFYRLGVQILTVTLATRPENGGLLELEDLLRRLRRKGGGLQNVSRDDVERALGRLTALGEGVSVIKRGGRLLILSVPEEMTGGAELPIILDRAAEDATAKGGHQVGVISRVDLEAAAPRGLGWSVERAEAALALLVRESLVWVDGGEGADPSDTVWPLYWFPSLAGSVVSSSEPSSSSNAPFLAAVAGEAAFS